MWCVQLVPGEVTHFPDQEGWARTMQPVQDSLDGSPLEEDAPHLDMVSLALLGAGSHQSCHVGPHLIGGPRHIADISQAAGLPDKDASCALADTPLHLLNVCHRQACLAWCSQAKTRQAAVSAGHETSDCPIGLLQLHVYMAK